MTPAKYSALVERIKGHAAPGGKWVKVWMPDAPETVAEMVARLARGETVLCRAGARGRLTGALKRVGVFTRQATQPNGAVLFTPCGEREFK